MKTNYFYTAIITGAMSLVTFTSCNDGADGVKTDEDSTKMGMQSSSDVAQDKNETAMPEPREDDASFCTKAAAANMAEINAHKSAIARSGNAEVKSNAKMMLADHEAMAKGMMAYAKMKGIVLPTEPDNGKKQMLADVEMKTGADYDKAWAAAQVKDHEEVVDMFEDNDGKRSDPELNKMIAENLPKLRMHLDMSKQLNDKLSK